LDLPVFIVSVFVSKEYGMLKNHLNIEYIRNILLFFFFIESDVLGVILDTLCKISGVIPLSNADNIPIIPKLKKVNDISIRKTAKNIPTYNPINVMYETIEPRYKLGSLVVDNVSKNKITVNTGALTAAIIANHLNIFFVEIIPLMR